MELMEAIRGRRSVRSYLDKSVEKDKIQKVIDAGVWAPSGFNSQPWEFVVIEDKEMINRLSKRTAEIIVSKPWGAPLKERFDSTKDPIFYNAPVVILITVKKPEAEDQKAIKIMDCALATQNMFLKAYEEGLGSCFMGFAGFLSEDSKLLEELGIPTEYILVNALIIGYYGDESSSSRAKPKILNWIG